MIFKYNISEEITVRDFLCKMGIPGNVLKNIRHQNGQLLVNDQSVSSIYMMKPGDFLEVVFASTEQGNNIVSIKGDFTILYEDSYLLIINKESNLATIPTKKHYHNSLANYVMSYYKRMGIVSNIHFISRLDAPTSGIITLAKNSYMVDLMKDSKMVKKYLLETVGKVFPEKGDIKTGIKRDPNSIIKRMVDYDEINSHTSYETIAQLDGNSVILATLKTGKTHQLRLHFSNLGYPIIGDVLYGNGSDCDILHLHSHYLQFIHPITKKDIAIVTYPTWYKE